MLDPRQLWTSLAQSLTSTSLIGWVIAAILILLALKSLMARAGQVTRPVAQVLEEAARLNAARATSPRIDRSLAMPNVEHPRQ